MGLGIQVPSEILAGRWTRSWRLLAEGFLSPKRPSYLVSYPGSLSLAGLQRGVVLGTSDIHLSVSWTCFELCTRHFSGPGDIEMGSLAESLLLSGT